MSCFCQHFLLRSFLSFERLANALGSLLTQSSLAIAKISPRHTRLSSNLKRETHAMSQMGQMFGQKDKSCGSCITGLLSPLDLPKGETVNESSLIFCSIYSERLSSSVYFSLYSRSNKCLRCKPLGHFHFQQINCSKPRPDFYKFAGCS